MALPRIIKRIGAPRLVVPAVATLLLVAPQLAKTATAQDIPYHNYLVGDRALGLGGAFVGLADDPAASFHNPAGLALLPEASISVSFWVMAFYHREVESGWLTLEGTNKLSDEEFTAPPLVATAVAKLGRRDALGRKRHAVGLAILKPLRNKYRFSAVARSNAMSSLSSLDVIHSDQARWYGLSYAYDTQCGVALGASAFLSLRSIRHEEIEIHGQNGMPDPSPPGFALTRHSVFSTSLAHLITRMGVMWTPLPRKLHLGAMFQLPTLSLNSDSDNREVTVDLVPSEDGMGPSNSIVERIEHDFINADRPIPWELRLGATWFPTRDSLLTADLTIHGSADIRLINDPGVPRPRLMATKTDLGPSVRAAIGGELFARKRVPIRGGIFIYRSGLPDVPERSDSYEASDLNTLGASFSVGWILSDGHELSFGIAGTYATGEGSALDQTDPAGASYLATPVSETTALVFMSGGKRAFKRLAKRIYKESEQLIRRGQGWMERE